MFGLTKIGDIIAMFGGKLFNLFKLGASAIVARVLAAFGLATISLNTATPMIKDFLASYTASLDPVILAYMHAFGVDQFMTMVLSALSVALAGRVMIVPKPVADQWQAIGGGS